MTSSFTLNSLLSGGTSSYQEEVHIDRNGNVYIPSAARQQQYSPAPVQQQQQQQHRQQQQPSRQAPAAPRAPVVTLALRVMRQLKKRCITASTVHSSMSKVRSLLLAPHIVPPNNPSSPPPADLHHPPHFPPPTRHRERLSSASPRSSRDLVILVSKPVRAKPPRSLRSSTATATARSRGRSSRRCGAARP